MSALLDAMSATAEWIGEAKSAGTPVADAARAMRQTRAARLTAAQRRRVRQMLEDGEAYTRAEAVAWVLAFEPEGSR